jgi:hypothetical protein
MISITENCEVVIKEEQGERLHVDYDSDLEDVPEHPGQLCRLCASAVNEVVYIYSGNGEKQRIADKINMCLPVTVSSLYN